MKLTRLVVIAIISASMGVGALSAQTRPGSEPAEFPPASFLGKQYVDSKGCVFIRAGIDGNVSWVPRVSRARTGVCGFKPTLAGQVTQAPAAAPMQTAAITQITNPPAAAAPAPVPRPAPVVEMRPAPQPVPRPAPQPVMRQVAKAPPPPIVEKTVQTAPATRTATLVPQGSLACPNASAVGGQYLRTGKYTVRCGPQTLPIVGARISTAPGPRNGYPGNAGRSVAAAGEPINVAPQTRIVPRHVAVNRVNTTNVTVPHGYKRVWEDGRLNPKRAEQTLAGHAAMSLVWTSTVPRRLINQANDRDVTASVPLVYPYVDYATQHRELGQVTIVQRNGQVLKRVLRGARSVVDPEPRQARVVTAQRKPVYSSRSTPKAAPKVAAQRVQPKAEVAARGYVQVGQFRDTAAAHDLAGKVQRMGMPVRVGRYTSNGETMRLVIAGPFGGAADVDRAVSKLRSAGYKAFAR